MCYTILGDKMEKKSKKEKGTGFGDNLGWLILYLVLNGICTAPLIMATALKNAKLPEGKEVALEPAITFFNNNGPLISFILLFILLLFVILKKKSALVEDIKKFKKDKKRNIIYTIIGAIVLTGIGILLPILREHLFSSEMSANQAGLASVINDKTPLYSLVSYFLILSIVIPMLEEIFCRLNFRKSFKTITMFIIITSLLFGMLHMTNASLSISFIYDLFMYSSMGACLGYVYYKTDSICSSMIMHILNNSLSVIIMILPFIK